MLRKTMMEIIFLRLHRSTIREKGSTKTAMKSDTTPRQRSQQGIGESPSCLMNGISEATIIRSV